MTKDRPTLHCTHTHTQHASLMNHAADPFVVKSPKSVFSLKAFVEICSGWESEIFRTESGKVEGPSTAHWKTSKFVMHAFILETCPCRGPYMGGIIENLDFDCFFFRVNENRRESPPAPAPPISMLGGLGLVQARADQV